MIRFHSDVMAYLSRLLAKSILTIILLAYYYDYYHIIIQVRKNL